MQVEFVSIVKPNTFICALSVRLTFFCPFSSKKLREWGMLCVRKLRKTPGTEVFYEEKGYECVSNLSTDKCLTQSH